MIYHMNRTTYNVWMCFVILSMAEVQQRLIDSLSQGCHRSTAFAQNVEGITSCVLHVLYDTHIWKFQSIWMFKADWWLWLKRRNPLKFIQLAFISASRIQQAFSGSLCIILNLFCWSAIFQPPLFFPYWTHIVGRLGGNTVQHCCKSKVFLPMLCHGTPKSSACPACPQSPCVLMPTQRSSV